MAVRIQPLFLVPGFALLLMFLVYALFPGSTGGKVCLFRLATVAFFFSAGTLSYELAKPADPGLIDREMVVLRGRVLSWPECFKDRVSFDFRMDCGLGDSSLCLHKSVIRVSLKSDVRYELPRPGEYWQIRGELRRIEAPKNPGEVNYQRILQRRNCWFRLYAHQHDRMCRPLHVKEKYFDAFRVRRVISSGWEEDLPGGKLLRAICLGDRSALSDSDKGAFVKAGAMHLLAVSGLHVGLLWWVLIKVFFPLKSLTGREWPGVFLVLMLLWYYAYLTGFSSSVCRALVMLSCYSIAPLLGRRSGGFNASLLSAYVLLLITPSRIFDLGFQLSYLAVLGIIFLYPRLQTLVRPRLWLFRWLADASAISVAAQISTLPLVLYYFRQYPVYGLLSNLLALPLLTFLLIVFILVLPFLLSGTGLSVCNGVLHWLAGLLNKSMLLISGLPHALAGPFYPRTEALVLGLCALFTLLAWSVAGERRWLYGLIFLAGFQLSGLNSQVFAGRKGGELRIAHIHEGSLLSIREGQQVDHYLRFQDTLAASRILRYINQAWMGGGNKNRLIFLSRAAGAKLQARGQHSCCVRLGSDSWLVRGAHCRIFILGDRLSHPGILSGMSEGAENSILLLSGTATCSSGSDSCRLPLLVADGMCSGGLLNHLQESEIRPHITCLHGAFCRTW